MLYQCAPDFGQFPLSLLFSWVHPPSEEAFQRHRGMQRGRKYGNNPFHELPSAPINFGTKLCLFPPPMFSHEILREPSSLRGKCVLQRKEHNPVTLVFIQLTFLISLEFCNDYNDSFNWIERNATARCHN